MATKVKITTTTTFVTNLKSIEAAAATLNIRIINVCRDRDRMTFDRNQKHVRRAHTLIYYHIKLSLLKLFQPI